MASQLMDTHKSFDPAAFLANAGFGRKLLTLKSGSVLFTQGTDADSVYYIQKGRVKVTVVSTAGKEATVSLLSAGQFVGEEAVGVLPGMRLCSATAIGPCS